MKRHRLIGPVALMMITGIATVLVARMVRRPDNDGVARSSSVENQPAQFDDMIAPTLVPTEEWVAYEAGVLATMTAQASEINSRFEPAQLVSTETPAYPVPLSEENAKQVALQLVPETSNPHDVVARLITHETLKTTIGWGVSNAPPEELLWLVAVKTTGMQSDYLGRQAGFDPSGLMTPEPVDGYVVAVSIKGAILAHGSLVNESSDANQRYSVIASLENETSINK